MLSPLSLIFAGLSSKMSRKFLVFFSKAGTVTPSADGIQKVTEKILNSVAFTPLPFYNFVNHRK
jgi:hypothetical protein